MRTPTIEKQAWYEVQRLYNEAEGNPGEWLMWEQFPYECEAVVDRGPKRLAARTRAKRELRNCTASGWKTRLIHCELLEEKL